MSSDQVKIDATSNANIIVGGIDAALNNDKALDKFGKVIQEATKQGVQKGVDKGIKSVEVKELEIKTKVKRPDTSELEKFKYELAKGYDLKLNTKLSKQNESDVKGLVKKISGLVEKEFQKLPVASYDAVKRKLPELTAAQERYVNTQQANPYRERLLQSGTTISDEEFKVIKDRFIAIKKVRTEIENIESIIGGKIQDVRFDTKSIHDVSKLVQELYRLKTVLNDLNKPGDTQITDKRTLGLQNPENARKQLERYKEEIINRLFSTSGLESLITSSNASGKFNTTLYDKVNQRYKEITDRSIKEAEVTSKQAAKEQQKYDRIFAKMSQFRNVTSDQSERYLTRLSNEIAKSKNKDSASLSPTRTQNLMGYYFAYKNAGNNPSSINSIFDEWMKEYTSDVQNNEFLPYYKALTEIFSLTDEQFNQKLAEIQPPEIDTKPIEQSEKKVRKEIQETDKVIEDSKKKRNTKSSEDKSAQKPDYSNYAKPDKTYSEDELNHAKSRGIYYKLVLGNDFTTENSKKSKKQVSDTHKSYSEFLMRDKLDTYLGTLAEYSFLKSYSDAVSKGIASELDDDITDNGYLNSKLSNGSYAWEKQLKLARARLLMYASVNDQIESADKSIFKQVNLSDNIERLVNHMFLAKYHKDNDVRDTSLERALEDQNDINQIIEKATGKKNVVSLISEGKKDVSQHASKQKQDEAKKIVEANNAISDSEAEVADAQKKTSEIISDKKSAVKSKQEESKAIVDANKKEAESEKKLADTKEKTEESKSKTQKSGSKKDQKSAPKPEPKPEEKPKEDEKPEPSVPAPNLSSKENLVGQSKDQTEALDDVADSAEKAAKSVGKLNDKTKEAGKSAEKTQKNVKKENEEFQGTQVQANAAASAKQNFDEANKKVSDGAEKSTKSLKKEKKALQGISEEEVLDNLEEYDKLTTVENGSGDVTSYTGVTTKKTDSAYVTTTQKYKANEDGDFELSYTSIVEDVKKLKAENSKNEEKVRKANDKLDKFINNIDLQMGGKINAMQLRGYSELKHISSIDEIDGLIKRMQDLDSERKKLFDSSKTNRKDLFGINDLHTTVSNIVSDFNALKNPSDELGKSIEDMIKLDESLKGASGIYEQAEIAGKLRDSISECNTQIKEQQNLEINDNKKSILESKKNIGFQQLDELEKRLSNSSRLSDEIKQKISEAREVLTDASSDDTLGVFNAKLSELNKLEKSAPVDENNFARNWDKWLSVIDKNNASQNFGNINLPTESNSAFNDVDAITEYITNKVKQATSLSKNISRLQKDLAKEISKPNDEQNSQIIEDIKKNIEADRKSLQSIISNDIFKDRDKYISKDISNAYRDAEVNLRKSTDDLNNVKNDQEVKKPIIEQYDAAIQKIKELKAAQDEVTKLQKEQLDNPYKDMSDSIDVAKQNVKDLKKVVDDSRKSLLTDDTKKILGDDRINEFNKQYDSIENNVKKNNKSLEDLMIDAYKRYQTAENNILKEYGKKNSNNGRLESYKQDRETFKKEYERLRQEVNEAYGGSYDDSAFNRIVDNFSKKKTETIKDNIQAITDSIEQFKSKYNSDNEIGRIAKEYIDPYEQQLSGIKDKITKGFKLDQTDIDNILRIKDAVNKGPDVFNSTSSGKAFGIQDQLDKLGKYSATFDKIPSYTTKLNDFAQAFHNIMSDENISEDDKIKKLDELSDRITKFSKNAKSYQEVNSKGRLIPGFDNIQDVKDVENALRSYAAQMKLGKELSTTINSTSGTVTMQFQGQNGAITTLTGSIEDYINALRVMNSEQSKSGSSFKSFSGTLKSIAGGGFKDVLSMFSSYFSGYKVISTVMSQLKEGFNTLKQYDDSMTTISYTMNMTQSQLESLGSSAVDMAQDLSMSLDNAMSIYQIYANMNTTAQEIQDTAKPTAILSNLSGVDTSTAADQVQGILQQFHMLEDGSQNAADASMHVVDVLDKISANVSLDYAKGIKIISDAVQASGQVAYDAGMSYEQLAAVTAKVAERTREDGGTIGNAIKTIVTRISKVGKMPQYASEVSNEELSNASKSLHDVGIEVYNTDGSFRELDVILGELSAKWDTLSDAQQSNISYNIAATRPRLTSVYRNIYWNVFNCR